MNRPGVGAVAFLLLVLQGCTVEVRNVECDSVPAVEHEACLNAARDPKWAEEEERRERVEDATTEEEKRQAQCEALQEPELTRCLAGAREPEERD